MNKIEQLNFIEALGGKTVERGRPNEFSDYQIHKTDFKTLMDIIKGKEVDLLILPKESAGGSVEGYDIMNAQGRLLMRFGQPNLPPEKCGYTLEKLFPLWVQDEDNLALFELLKEEKIITMELRESFSAVKSLSQT